MVCQTSCRRCLSWDAVGREHILLASLDRGDRLPCGFRNGSSFRECRIGADRDEVPARLLLTAVRCGACEPNDCDSARGYCMEVACGSGRRSILVLSGAG